MFLNWMMKRDMWQVVFISYTVTGVTNLSVGTTYMNLGCVRDEWVDRQYLDWLSPTRNFVVMSCL